MAGGFLKQHKIRDCSWENCDEPKPDDKNDEYDYYGYDDLSKRRRRRAANDEEYQEQVGGGTTNGQTWMFEEGKYWTQKAQIPTPRDRPSCSLVNMPNGKVNFRSKLDFGQQIFFFEN